MLEQFVAVMPGTLGPALLVMCMSVMLTVGEGRDKPISSRWRLWGILIGLVAAIVFAGLRASAVINQRTFINYPVLWCCVVIDLLLIVLVFVNRLITRNWRRHAAVMHLANLVAALGIALTVFYALPDVILQLTIWVEPGDPICCCVRSALCWASSRPRSSPRSSARCVRRRSVRRSCPRCWWCW